MHGNDLLHKLNGHEDCGLISWLFHFSLTFEETFEVFMFNQSKNLFKCHIKKEFVLQM